MEVHLIKFGTKKHRLDFLFSEKYLRVCALGKFVTGELATYDQSCDIHQVKRIYDALKDIDYVSVVHLTPKDKSVCVLKIKGEHRGMGWYDEINIHKKVDNTVVFSVFCGCRYHSHEFILSKRKIATLQKELKKFYNEV